MGSRSFARTASGRIKAACGEGAAAVADEMDPVVIGAVVRRDEAVGLADVVVQPRAEDAALQAIEGTGSDALDVADLLRHSPDATRHSRIDLRNVRMGVGVAPRSVEEHSDVHTPRPARTCNSSPPFLEEREAEAFMETWCVGKVASNASRRHHR